MISGRTVAVHTLGCKVNTYESEAMLAALRERGYTPVPFAPGADFYLINTCSVTNIADRKSRQMLHRAKAMNPEAAVVAIGCYAQAAGEAVLADEAVDIVVGNERKKDIADILDAYAEAPGRQAVLTDIGAKHPFEEMRGSCSEHTRAFLKIEDGCNQFCSYCLIPYVRGRVRSRAPELVREEAERLVGEGFKELVLTGIHMSSYGLDFNGDSAANGRYGLPLVELLESLSDIPGLKRIRLGSLEPRLVRPDTAARLAALPKLCPHFHLSLQSGSDSVLKRMNRKYTAEEFYEEMCLLREAFDRPALTTDVIAGFPGETEAEFAETLKFLEKAKFYETHIFRYSRRKGTAADKMSGQIPEAVKAERSARLLELNRRNRTAFAESFFGEEREILLEEPVIKGGKTLWTGHSPEYLRVEAELPAGESGALVRLRLNRANLFTEEEEV